MLLKLNGKCNGLIGLSFSISFQNVNEHHYYHYYLKGNNFSFLNFKAFLLGKKSISNFLFGNVLLLFYQFLD